MKKRWGYVSSVLCLATTAGLFFRWSAVTDAASTSNEAELTLQSERDTRLYIDQHEVGSGRVTLTPGRHLLVGVASGHYGQVRMLLLNASTSRQVLLHLEPTTLPDAEVTARFLVLTDAASITNSDVEAIPEHTLRVSLRHKLLRQERNEYAASRLRQELTTLIQLGDTRAAVAAFIIDAIQAGRFQESLVSEPLRKASLAGDAMASFFLAIASRDALLNRGTESPDNPDFKGYCARLALAKLQGWAEVVDEWLERDGCSG